LLDKQNYYTMKKHVKLFEEFISEAKKEYMQDISVEEFAKIQKGASVQYMGGTMEVINNDGFVIVLKDKYNKMHKANLAQFNHGGRIQETINEEKERTSKINTLAKFLRASKLKRGASLKDVLEFIKDNFEDITGAEYEEHWDFIGNDFIADILSHFKYGEEAIDAWKSMFESEVNESNLGLKAGMKITIENDDEDGDFKAGEYDVISSKKFGNITLSGMGQKKLELSSGALKQAGFTINESEVNEDQTKMDFGGNELGDIVTKFMELNPTKKGTKYTHTYGVGTLTLDIKGGKIRGAEFSDDRAHDFLKHMEEKGFGPDIYGTLETLAKDKKLKGYNTILMFESLNEDQSLNEAVAKQGKQPVNIMVGRFQPFHIGHFKACEELHKENGNPIVLVTVRGSGKSGKGTAFTEPTMDKMMKDVIKKSGFIIDHVEIKFVAFDTQLFPALRPKYEPVLMGAGDDRIETYERQTQSMRVKHENKLNIREDFAIQLTGRYGSGTAVRQSITDQDQKAFNQSMPSFLHGYWDILSKEMAVTEADASKEEEIIDGPVDTLDRIERTCDDCKQDLAKTGASIEKLKSAISKGAKDTKTFEALKQLEKMQENFKIELNLLEGMVSVSKETLEFHMGAYKVDDDPYDVAKEIGAHYGWSEKNIEKAEKLIRKYYLR